MGRKEHAPALIVKKHKYLPIQLVPNTKRNYLLLGDFRELQTANL